MKEIPGFPGYFVTETGDVFSVHKGCLRQLKPYIGPYGYLGVNLMAPGAIHTRMPVHKAVLITFRGAYPGSGWEARHLDGNKTNNSLANLVWGTRRENADDRIRHGSCRNKYRLKEELISSIRSDHSTGIYTQVELARKYGLSQSCISTYVRGNLSNRGERNGQSKFGADAVREIRALAARGIQQKQIASIYGVGPMCISRIVRRERWAHI
jgi:predicted XRE-type DNA-binding protein